LAKQPEKVVTQPFKDPKTRTEEVVIALESL
jgi:hypothetical protein